MKSERSVKSSMKSLKTSGPDSVSDENTKSSVNKTTEIDDYIKDALLRFYCPYEIIVIKETRHDDFYKNLIKSDPPVKHKKIALARPPRQSTYDSDFNFAGPEPCKPEIDKNVVIVTATYDDLNRLVELSLSKVKVLPRVLMQIIGLLVPYYLQLNKITIKKSKIDKFTIYELNRMLPLSNLTEVCLDESPLPEANYAILLDGQSCLRSLSLSKCLVNDEACKQIVDKLRYLQPGEPTLSVLNLSSNHITDVGAKYIGEALRSNRHLRYLNLADNRITDDGANHIFNVLDEFPLTYQEVLEKRHRYMNYVILKQAFYDKDLNEFDSKSVDDSSRVSKKSMTKKKDKSIAPLKSKGKKLETISYSDDQLNIREPSTGDPIGIYQDPYGPGFVKLKNGYSYCTGNWILCYLNLSYNHLSYLTVKKLSDIVNYQQLNKKFGQVGLMKVMLDGNYMPTACSELTAINDILQKNINCFGSKSYTTGSSRYSGRTSTAGKSNAL